MIAKQMKYAVKQTFQINLSSDDLGLQRNGIHSNNDVPAGLKRSVFPSLLLFLILIAVGFYFVCEKQTSEKLTL